MRFGSDGKLYIFMGDQGRRGWLQNLENGPFETPPFVDDTFGGPQPDNAHLSGVILRLNDDGSAPSDNPFFGVGSQMGGEVGANIQKIFSYGHRNGFGMAFDPYSGDLGETENDHRQGIRHHRSIEQGPDGNLYVVSITDGTIYKISHK